jgi:hypothetical protein
MLYIDRKSRRWFSLRALTYLQIDVRSRLLPTDLLTITTASLERIRVPLEIFSIITRPFPFPGTSCKAYMELCSQRHFRRGLVVDLLVLRVQLFSALHSSYMHLNQHSTTSWIGLLYIKRTYVSRWYVQCSSQSSQFWSS